MIRNIFECTGIFKTDNGKEKIENFLYVGVTFWLIEYLKSRFQNVSKLLTKNKLLARNKNI